MSLSVETENRGTIGGFGFFSPDVFRIGLGELAPMPLHQFAPFATDTILAALPYTGSRQRDQLEQILARALNEIKVSKIPIRRFSSPLDFPKEFKAKESQQLTKLKAPGATFSVARVVLPEEALKDYREAQDPKQKALAAEAVLLATVDSLSGPAVPYEQNPFRVAADGTIAIASDYTGIDLVDFTFLTVHVLSGGFYGWDKELGIPELAYRELQRLAASLTV